MKTRRWTLILSVTFAVVIFVALPFINWLARVWTDYLWYQDLGQSAVFITRITSQLAIGIAFALAAFILLFGNMRVARGMAPKVMPVGLPEGVPPQLAEVIEVARLRMGPWLDRAILIAAAWFAFVSGSAQAARWTTYRIALEGPKFGMSDPQFGRDIGFYIFRLPALESIGGWLTGILVLTIVLTLAVHLLDGAIQPWARLKGFAPHVKAHLSVLLALFVLSRGYAYWLDIWNLNYSPRGQVLGASYADVHAQLPAYRILIIVSLVTAGLLLFNIRARGWRLPAIALGAWVAISILVGGVWPALVQQFRVAPNEAALEAPYIKRNIAMTRYAYGLTALKGQKFPASNDLTAKDIIANRQTLSNVRLWDPDIVAQSYSQLQSIRSYYDFRDVDVDRYDIGGTKRQVLVSAREIDSSLLDAKAQNWVNRHLVYTHGIGLVMSPVSEADTRGLPEFLIGDIPPRVSDELTGTAKASLVTKQPRIYFGEDTTDYVIVDTLKKEFDYPRGDTNAMYVYKGGAGPKMGSLARRIAWALRFGSSQILFSSYVRPESRVLMNRDLRTRVSMLAPFLRLEDDPYPVLVDGRIIWVMDAYTTSSRFPYSERIADGTNYIRNSVKVTVDAYTGETKVYAFDEKDPVLKAWRGVFPELITDASEIPAGIRAHFRFPQGLFTDQAEIYRTYHMTDVNVFYNKEDQWEIPGQRKGTAMEPFFVLLTLPGQAQEHFYLMQPYTPRNRDNMIGWMAASSDPENFGERTVYQFPKERVVLGPDQVTARINQDSAISPQLSLWNQRGSQVIFGNMQVIPIEDSIVYIVPLFLQAQETAIPELTRVIVVYSDKVEMARDLETALLQVFGGQAPSAEETGTARPGGGGTGVAATAAQAQRLYEQAIAAQRKGDWAEYGRLIERLGTVLQGLSSKEGTKTP